MVHGTGRHGGGNVRFFLILRTSLSIDVPINHNTFCLVYSAVLLFDRSYGTNGL